jgi:RimJ/RimL family protein N-acetyltransferase
MEVHSIMKEEQFRLRAGQSVTIRPIRPDDAPALVTAVAALSEQSRYFRFHTHRPQLADSLVEFLTDIDHHDHEALVAQAPGAPEIVGVARFIRDPDNPGDAEVAVLVADAWQRRGVGTLLLAELARRASAVGISQFTAEVLTENTPTLALVRHLDPPEMTRDVTRDGATVSAHLNTTQLASTLPRPVAHLDADALLRALAEAHVVLVPRLLGVFLDLSAELTHTLVLSVPPLFTPVRKRAS